MLTNKQFTQFKQELPDIIDIYKKEYSEQKPTNSQTYEKQWAQRLTTALKELKTVINQTEQKRKNKTQAHRQAAKSTGQTKSPHFACQRHCPV